MGSAKFSLMEKTLDLDTIEGKYSAFARAPFALPVRMSKPLAPNGYGSVTVDGKPVDRGVPFEMDTVIKMYCLLVPVGAAVWEYDREYTICFKGFTAADGTPFKEQSFKFRTAPRGKKDPAYEKHDAVALKAAREGMVLLKNENGALPMAKDAVLNCFGAAQYIFRNSSTGASLIHPRWQSNFHQAVQEHSGFQINEEISGLYRTLQDTLPTQQQLAAAKAKSGTALVFLSRCSGEFLDNKPVKGGYYLTDAERELIHTVAAAFPKTVAVINTGYPIEMGWVDEYGIDAVLYTGFAGQGAGEALVEILDGCTNPSGKLPDTWAYDYYDHPSAKNFINFSETDTVPGEKDNGVLLYYEEDIYVGYRYFDTFQRPAAFCFGHGLSYTDFSRTTQSHWENGAWHAEVTVTNTGKCAGKEVVQFYVGAPEGMIEKARRVLVGFEKTKLLQPGESQTIAAVIPKANFASFDEASHSYVLEAGEYVLYCGSSLQNAEEVGRMTLEGETLRRVQAVNLPVETLHRMTKADPEVHGVSRLTELAQRIPTPAKRQTRKCAPATQKKGVHVLFSALQKDESLLDVFVGQMSDKELCRLNVCGGANWYLPWQDGCAGKSVALRKYGLPSFKVSDGNAGLNLKKPNIGFPCSTVVAATFNKELAFAIGEVIGQESAENGIAVNLGPGMNIHRNILNGRHPEYFSEDPMLAGTMAGWHGKGIASTHVGCTYKHLFCNNSDTSRKGSHSIVSEQALREIYYRVFEYAIDIQMPSCVMTSYNAVNGLYPAENAEVLQTLIRQEWGFDGLIMTDWGTYDTVDPVEMAKAGNCWLTEGAPKYAKQLLQAVKDGRLSRAELKANARHLVALALRFAPKGR